MSKEVYTSKEELNPRKPISRGKFVLELTNIRTAWINEIERLNELKLGVDLQILDTTKSTIKVETLMRDTLLAEQDTDLKVNYFVNEVDNQLFTEIKPKGRFGFLRGGGK